MTKSPSFKLFWTGTFVRTSKKFFKRHPELLGTFNETLSLLQRNPNDPSLKSHWLKGSHKDKFAIRLTYSYRIVYILKIIENKIILMDIGSHDDVYR